MNKGWQKQRLTTVTVKITDGSHNPPKGVAESDYLMLSSKNVFDDDLHYANPRYLTAEQYQQEDKRTGVVPGDVLLTIVGTIGRSAVVPTDTPRITLQRSVAVIRPNRQLIEPRFLMYSFIERCAELNEQARGVAQKGIYLETLRGLDLMLPPLEEQKQIVGILDEAFEGIATAKANAEKNLQNARALFESHLNSVFSQKGDGWGDAKLSDICGIKHGFAFRGKDFSKSVREGNPVVITPGNFTEDGKLLFNDRNTKRFRGETPAGFQFDVGDLVIVMTDLSSKMKILGKPAFIETNDVLHNQRIGRVVFTNDCVEKRLLYYFMMTEGFLKNIKLSATGTMVKHTAPKRILGNEISFPNNPEEQRAIISTLDDVREETQRLSAIYERKAAALEELKKSLLHRAFNGEL